MVEPENSDFLIERAMLGEYSACLAHELRNIIQTAWSKTSLLREDGNSSQDQFRKCLDGLDNDFQRMSSIEKHIISLFKDSRDSAQENQRIQVRQFVSSITDSLNHLIYKTEVSVVNNIESTLEVVLPSTSCWLIFANFIANAVDAAADSADKCVHITAEYVSQTSVLKLMIIDSGAGVPGDRLEKIYQLSYSSKSTPENAGIGLSLAKRCLEKLGGSVQYSRITSRSIFCISIPANLR